jgi:hypothetical protein
MPSKHKGIPIPRCVTVDFEGHVIKRRPMYPPKATGVAIKWPGEKVGRYYSWAHPEKNNCTEAVGRAAIQAAWNAAKAGHGRLPATGMKSFVQTTTDVKVDGLLMQNGKFDLDVAETHYDCPRLDWSKYHELQFLLFLNNPHSYNLQLKSQAKELLGIMPEEKDEAIEWLQEKYGKGFSKKLGVARLPDPRPYIEGREPDQHAKPERVKWYAMVGLAPGDIVGRLAIGDIDRTQKLFEHLYPYIVESGMVEAYDRERRLVPILLENEREGVLVDIKLLRKDVLEYQAALVTVENWLRKRLKTPNLNFNNDEDFAQALADCKLVDEHKWVYTPKSGKRSVSKKNLTPDMVNDQKVAQAYGYRNRLVTCLGTFMQTWLRQAESTLKLNGRPTIHTLWKQVKASSAGGSEEGAATSRLSSSPNFQNIPKGMEDKGDGFVHPAWLKVPQLPLMRKYLLPDEGHVWGHADYDGQELRLLAHFGDGAPEWSEYIGGQVHMGPPVPGEMLEQYNTNPEYKVHKVVHNGIGAITGHVHTYQAVKNFDFQVVYGGGIPAVSAALKVDRDTAIKAIEAFKTLLPDYDRLNTHIKVLAKAGGFITTWGGIRFYKEPDHYNEEHGRWMDFGYKLLNYLIQGSAAQCTKEAIIRYHEHPKRQARFLITVHDEINISIPKHRIREEMLILLECMQSIELDLLLKAEPKIGPRWSETKDYEMRKAA